MCPLVHSDTQESLHRCQHDAIEDDLRIFDTLFRPRVLPHMTQDRLQELFPIKHYVPGPKVLIYIFSPGVNVLSCPSRESFLSEFASCELSFAGLDGRDLAYISSSFDLTLI